MVDSSSWRSLEVLVVSPTPTHPQDHGNRKRIFEICRSLRQRGAKVHFVHYPAEHDWRQSRPAQHEAAMIGEWDSYQLVAPTRPLHAGAAGWNHEIDEWADPSVTQYLAWACTKRRYDLAIVNYTWMSFALTAIPASTFKVLDTHDVFGNRRDLLEANGISPEFFHTTVADEARGLDRADLVWAIKESEREYFERDLGAMNTLTMLHAERQYGWWNSPPSKDGWLRVGVIGARNNVNFRNLTEFIEVVLPIFAKYMAPVKIVIAGGCSDDFKSWRHPNIEVLGRVSQVEDFYRAVDVVIVPMRFSTGLKIKVSEALASGAPMVAHAHAVEGYPTVEPLHLLPSFEAMAIELAKLSFDRSCLEKLAARSRTTCLQTQSLVDIAIQATRARVVEKISRKICLIAPLEALDSKSILCDHLHAAIDYIRFAADIELFFTGPSAKPSNALLKRYDLQHHVFVDTALWENVGESALDTWTPIELCDLLATRGYTRAYIMTDCRESLMLGSGNLAQVFVRHDMIEIAGGDPDALIDRLRKSVEVVVIGGAPQGVQRWEGVAGVEVLHAPVQRVEGFERLNWDLGDADAPDVFIMASQDDLLAVELAKLCERLGASARVLDFASAQMANAARRAQQPDPLAGLARAKLLVDLAPVTALSTTIKEAAMRAGVPLVAFARGSTALGFWRFGDPLRHASFRELLNTITNVLIDSDAHTALCKLSAKDMSARAKADAGWTLLWTLIVRRKEQESADGESPFDAAVSLFG